MKLTAAGDARGGDLLRTEACHLLKGFGDAQLLGGTGHVDGDTVPDLVPLQLVLQVRLDELYGLIQREPEALQPS